MPQRLEFKEVELREGLTLLHHRSDKWKTEVFRAFFPASLASGVAERSLAAYLLRHGHAGMRGMDAVSRHMQDLYGAGVSISVSRSDERHYLTVRGVAVADDYVPGATDPLARLFDYLNSLLTRPWFAESGFAASVFEREHANLLRAIDAIKDNKAQYAEQRLIQEMFGEHPFARPAYGFRDEVMAVGLADAAAEYRRLVAEAPMLLYVVSPRSTGDLAKILKRTLELKKRPEKKAARVKAPEIKARPKRVVEIDRVVQGRLAMGFRSIDYRRSRDAHAAILADMLFGGSSSSRLFKEVREKHSLAYSIHSGVDVGTGSSIVSAGIDPKNVPAAEKLVRRELRRLAAGRIDRAELDTVLVTIKKQLESISDSPDAMINFHSSRKLSQRKESDPAEAYARYLKVKPERIAEQAGRLVLDTVYVLGPEEKKR